MEETKANKIKRLEKSLFHAERAHENLLSTKTNKMLALSDFKIFLKKADKGNSRIKSAKEMIVSGREIIKDCTEKLLVLDKTIPAVKKEIKLLKRMDVK